MNSTLHCSSASAVAETAGISRECPVVAPENHGSQHGGRRVAAGTSYPRDLVASAGAAASGATLSSTESDMSLPEQILAALRNASGPMNSGEIRDAVGLEGAAGQTKVASALKNLLDRGALSREFEGGSYRYLAVPGWQPERRAGGRPKHDKAERTGSNPPPPKAAKPAPPPSPPSTAATLSVVVDASAATKAMDAALAELGDQVLLPRRTVRTLLAGILMFGDDLGDQLRDAVIDATQRAA